jgi:hypothetical protein
MPIAATGPSERFDARSESNRHMRPAMTVAADAVTGSTVPLIARHIAVRGSTTIWSSSR